jgi:transposase-like protein
MHVTEYMDGLGSVSKRHQHLAALRHFFDLQVTRHVVMLNPTLSVRGESEVVVEGKTPEIPLREATRLLASIDTSNVVGLRDRAAIGILAYTAARVGLCCSFARENGGMTRRRRQCRNPLFRKRWFADDTIVQCVNWYLRFKLSYRDLALMMGQLGVSVAPSTILRWVIRYSVDFAESMRPFEKPVGRSWRCDETYIKVAGQWMYLYRAVDERGKTVESHLSRTRDITAAKAFFRKALRRMGMRNEFNFRWKNPVKIRSCAYLNNIVEQDHRRIKARVKPMLGFKKFYNARRVLIGIEFMQKIHKGQYDLAAA